MDQYAEEEPILRQPGGGYLLRNLWRRVLRGSPVPFEKLRWDSEGGASQNHFMQIIRACAGVKVLPSLLGPSLMHGFSLKLVVT